MGEIVKIGENTMFKFNKNERYIKKQIRYSTSKYNPIYSYKNPKIERKRKEFLRKGGGLSGVYNVSDKRTASFVKEYRDFISKKEIYKKDIAEN